MLSQWQKRTSSSDVNWENWRPELFSAVVNSHVIPDQDVTCMACGEEPAVLRCPSCISQHLCPGCDDRVHSEKPLHDRQHWLDGFFKYLKPEQSVSSKRKVFQKVM